MSEIYIDGSVQDCGIPLIPQSSLSNPYVSTVYVFLEDYG